MIAHEGQHVVSAGSRLGRDDGDRQLGQQQHCSEQDELSGHGECRVRTHGADNEQWRHPQAQQKCATPGEQSGIQPVFRTEAQVADEMSSVDVGGRKGTTSATAATRMVTDAAARTVRRGSEGTCRPASHANAGSRYAGPCNLRPAASPANDPASSRPNHMRAGARPTTAPRRQTAEARNRRDWRSECSRTRPRCSRPIASPISQSQLRSRGGATAAQ